jgi:hypothetical protein
MRLTILFLLISSTTFGQISIMPDGLGGFRTTIPYEDSPVKFIRVDTIKGVVGFFKKGFFFEQVYPAKRIDSVFARRTERPYQCNAYGGGATCLVFHSPIIEYIEERKTDAIVMYDGKRIDLRKRYSFIPESEMQK